MRPSLCDTRDQGTALGTQSGRAVSHGGASFPTLPEVREHIEKAYLIELLARCQTRKEAAQRSGFGRQHFQKLLAKHALVRRPVYGGEVEEARALLARWGVNV